MKIKEYETKEYQPIDVTLTLETPEECLALYAFSEASSQRMFDFVKESLDEHQKNYFTKPYNVTETDGMNALYRKLRSHLINYYGDESF